MKTFFENFVKWLDSQGTAFHSNDVEKRKTTILIRACFLTGFFMILYIGNCYFIGFDIGFSILPFESLIFFSLPFLIKKGLKPKIAAHLYILNGTAFGILLVWFSGGLQSPVTPWLTLMPICAILFMDARSAWIWAFIILGIVSVMGMYWLFVGASPKDYDQSQDPLYFLNCYAGLIFIYLLLSLIFEKRLNATINELENSKASLQESNYQLNLSLDTLKKTQAQLIQSEKMASLGELTAGIAHEIQNPLNFVNNFSELSVDLANELKEELEKLEVAEKEKVYMADIIEDLSQNQEKINHHGKRASSIVKGMLEHSRKSSGSKEPTDINALTDEYLRFAYHGLKAKDQDFNATMETHFDPNLPKIEIIPQDFGRVILNLINNAFYAVNERSKNAERADSPLGAGGKDGKKMSPDYVPTVSVTTQLTADSQLLIAIKDNGPGIPDAIKDKIFQPFFTTKPTGQGTGLGLSLSYDIVKAHGGELKMESNEGDGTEFIIKLSV